MSRDVIRPWVFVIGGARKAGAEGQFVRLAVELHRAGEPIECVFLFGGGPLLADLDDAGVPWRVLRPLTREHSSRQLRAATSALAVVRLAWLLLRRRPEVVMAWLTFATWPTLLLAQLLTSASRVAGIRGEILPSEVRWASRLFRHALRHAHAVVVNSPALVEEATAWGAARSSVVLVSNGVDIPVQRSDARSRSAVVVANYRPYKGHADLLHALAMCDPSVRVRLCGQGEGRRDIEELARTLGVEEQVHFVPEPADVPAELSRAGFAIHPSRTEGLSNAILEQMAAGLPVIAMSVGGNPTLVETNVNGFLLNVGDHQALARAVDQLAYDDVCRMRLAAGSRVKVAAFTWEACTSRYLQLLRALSERGMARDKLAK